MGLELASRENLHPWVGDAQPAIAKYTVFPHQAIEEVEPRHFIKGMWSALNSLHPAAIAMGLCKETRVAWFTTLLWCRLKKRKAVLLMDSKYDDSPRNFIKERIKRLFISRFDAALVGGTYSRDYAEFLGIPAPKIFLGCDVVDNQHFAAQADGAGEQAPRLREQYGLPEDYFLYVGRIDDNKNISRLLESYDRYVRSFSGEAWHLLVCGSGPLEAELREKARQLGLHKIHFQGFVQIDQLPIYYGLARCLIFPSLGDTWGLVVNEAMASGLPVLVSKACGCVPDLVQEGVNGHTFDPCDVEALAQLMLKMSSGRVDLRAMRDASRKIIAGWSLETFAQNLLKAVEAGQN